MILFPDPSTADKDGLLAMGGDLSIPTLLQAYSTGIFPWYNESGGEPILWWCPDPRFVLFPHELRISKSMKSLLNKKKFRFTINTSFTQVISNCKSVARSGQDGTWINESMIKAYNELHKSGFGFSAETWLGEELVGGLYGVKLGKIFFGESMFSNEPNASKFAFINYIRILMNEGIELIDCQVFTAHLESLGARMIPRKNFLDILAGRQ